MDLELEGKVAVVTGTSAGIGLAVAEALAHEGMSVVGASRNDPERELAGLSHLRIDLTEPGVPARSIEHAVDLHGRLDVLVNHAGWARVWAGFLDEDDEQWARIFELNLVAAVRSMRAALPHLVARGGAIINISSINARTPGSDVTAYGAFHDALVNMSKAVDTE